MVLLVVEFFLGICSSLYPLVYGCVLRAREGKWPRRERVWGSEAEWEVEGGIIGRRGVSLAEYTLIGILILGAWRIMRGEDQGDEGRLGDEIEEKMRLVEEGREGCFESVDAHMTEKVEG